MDGKRALRRRVLGGFCAIWLAWSPAAHAQPARVVCVDAAVTVTGTLSPPWVQVVEQICGSLETLPDRDNKAQLEIAATETGARLTVRLADGRSAVRLVSRPADLGAAVEALLTLPPVPQPAEPTATEPAAPAPAVVAPSERPAPPLPADAAGGPMIAYEVAGLATSRLLGAPATFGFGAVVTGGMNIDNGWLVGLRLRADAALLDLSNGGEVAGGAFGGGVEGGRRLRLADTVKLDLGLGVDGLADVPYSDGHRGGGRRGDDATGDLRTRAFGKLWVSGRGVSFTGLLGFELSPVRIADSDRNERPAYGGELGLGVGWGGGS